MIDFTYHGHAYRQSLDEGVPWILSVVVPAEDLLEWAGIPRRSDQSVQGFQRVQDEGRVEKARDFFADPHNQSPTSLIIGLHPVTDAGGSVEIEFLPEDEKADEGKAAVVPVVVKVRVPESLELGEVAAVVRSRLESRIADDLDVADEVLDDYDPDEAESIEDEDSDDSEFDDEDTVQVGRSVLDKLLTHLDDDEWVAEAEEDLRDLAKPATIIDGQHRVLGAASLEQGLPFSALLMADCPWSEQVFQFTVVNYTAKGIPDQFITANAALSLTESELQALQARLDQAGVKVLEYELMRTVHWNPQSPFFELVDLSERRQIGKIGYKTMVRIAKSWYSAKRPFFAVMLEQLYPDVTGRAKVSRRRRRWQEGDWAVFFLDFWRAVHSTYAGQPSHVGGATLWDVGSSQLMIAAVLERLQENFFENLDLQDEVIFDLPESLAGDSRMDAMRKVITGRADKYLEWISPNFFATEWGMKSLNTGAGKQALDDVISELVRKKGKYPVGKSALVKGSTN